MHAESKYSFFEFESKTQEKDGLAEEKTGNSLEELFLELSDKRNSQFSELEYVKGLSELIPLTTDEMHSETKKIVQEAEKEVVMQFYKFHPDSDAAKLLIEGFQNLKLKAEKNKKSISIKIIVNSRGCISEKFYKGNEDTQLDKIAKDLNSEYFHLEFCLHRAEAFGSFHSKFIVVDSKKAMIRSTDIGRNDNYEYHRHESAMIVDKPLAVLLRKDFIKSWDYLTKNKITVSEKSLISPKQGAYIPCIFVSKTPSGNPFKKEWGPIKISLISLIDKAISSIKIITANINDHDICFHLARACSRGVVVQIVMGKHHNDKSENKYGGTNLQGMQSLVKMIDDNSMERLQIRWATDSKLELVRTEEKFAIHTKYACIDDKIVVTGSSPLDRQSLYNSREADIIFENPEKAYEFNSKFFTEKFTYGKDYFEDFIDNFEYVFIQKTSSFPGKTVQGCAFHNQISQTSPGLYKRFIKEVDQIISESKLSYYNLTSYQRVKEIVTKIHQLYSKKIYENISQVEELYKYILEQFNEAGIQSKSQQEIELHTVMI